MRVLLLALLLTGAMSERTKAAETLAATADVDFEEDRVGGNLVSCHLTYQLFVRDFVKRAGGIVRVSGSIGLTLPKPKFLGLWVRFFTADATKKPDGSFSMRPFKPAYAYATIGGLSTAHREMGVDICPKDGYCAGISDLALVGAAGQLAIKQQLIIAFQRSPGSLDVSGTVEFGEPDTAGGRALERYSACTVQLMQRLKANLG